MHDFLRPGAFIASSTEGDDQAKLRAFGDDVYSTHSLVRNHPLRASQPVSKPAPKCRQASQPAWFLKMTRNWVIRSIHKELRLKVDFGRHIPKSDQKSGKNPKSQKREIGPNQ